jgi:hypothetical protein
MWLRLLEIKAKQRMTALTSAEKDLRKATMDVEFNVPQPIHAFLMQMGNVTDKLGKETNLEIPPLPTTVNQGLGGYHSAAITAETHNAYEEIPSLGIASDMLMAAASNHEDPEPNFRMGVPEGAVVTKNLVCSHPIIGPRRVEIRQRVFSYGITPNAFPEYVTGTRLATSGLTLYSLRTDHIENTSHSCSVFLYTLPSNEFFTQHLSSQELVYRAVA